MWVPSLTAEVVGVVCGQETAHISLCVGDILIGAVIEKSQLRSGDVAPQKTFRVRIQSGFIEMYALHPGGAGRRWPLTGGLVMVG